MQSSSHKTNQTVKMEYATNYDTPYLKKCSFILRWSYLVSVINEDIKDIKEMMDLATLNSLQNLERMMKLVDDRKNWKI